MTPPEALLLDLDKLWQGEGKPRIRIRILGSMALMLQTNYERGTKDGDILDAHPIDAEIKERLLKLGGLGSALAKRHRVYLDVVTNGLLMLPAQPRYLPLPDFTAQLAHFEVEALSVPDVVISKLKPFRPTDIADIAAMIARGCVTHEQFQSLFLSAIDRFADGATGAAKLPKIVQNFRATQGCDPRPKPHTQLHAMGLIPHSKI